MHKNIPPFLPVLLPAILLPAFGALIGIGTVEGVDAWFATIQRPAFSPPPYLIGIMRFIIYTLMGVALGLILITPDVRGLKKPVVILFFVQLLINFLWSVVFFQLHWLWITVFWTILLIVLVVALMAGFWRIRRMAAILLVPYLCWLVFVAYLMWATAVLN